MEVKDLNIIPSGEMPIIHCSQFDVNRTIKFNLKEDNEDYTLESGVTITCAIKKVDGNLVTFEVTNTEGKYIELTLPEQATACAGINVGEVIFTDEDNYEIGSINFILDVERSPKQGGIESASSIHNLTTQIEVITTEIISDNYYTKSEVDSLIEAIPTFDPDNYYNKTQTDSLLDGKADKSTTYTKTEVDTALALKADKSTTYTKTEVDQKIIDIYPVNTASGSIATFTTSLALPLVDIDVDINATKVIHTTGSSSYAPFFKGLFEGTYGFVDLGTLTWTYSNTYFWATYIGVKDATINMICPIYEVNNSAIINMPDKSIKYIESTIRFIIKNSTYTDAQTFKTAMSGVYLIYELATPTTPTITAEEFSTLCTAFNISGDIYTLPLESNFNAFVGEQNVFTDYGNTEVSFKQDIANFVEAKISEANANRNVNLMRAIPEESEGDNNER